MRGIAGGAGGARRHGPGGRASGRGDVQHGVARVQVGRAVGTGGAAAA